MTRVLSVASEVFPLVKTGGLADVAGALPLALAGLDVETTTVVPAYPSVLAALKDATVVHRFADLFGGPADVLAGRAGGLDLLAIDAPHLYARAGSPYFGPDGLEWPDNDVRFAGLGAAAAALAVGAASLPAFDVLHAHDWQASLAVVYLFAHVGRRPATVLTVHNLAFQGVFPASLFARLGLPAGLYGLEGLEYYGQVSFLKGGLICADWLTTVSPTYAREITEPATGAGLDGVLRRRAGRLSGILNGIDDSVWNPAEDTLIASPFAPGRLARRAANKVALQQRLRLDPRPDALVIGVVSRLTQQKGLDLLLGQIAGLVAAGVQIAILGNGEPALQQGFTMAATAHPGMVGCVIGYDEAMAHLMQAGTDALLVPSRFEPCGLTQLCALRYGSIPVVSRVGGLADTVIDANEAAVAGGVATGIQFGPVTPAGLTEGLRRALVLWRDRPVWQRMQRNAMRVDVSWRRSAERYAALYRSLEAERA